MNRLTTLGIAKAYHLDQTYGDEPYVNHLERVAERAERLAPFYHVDPELAWNTGILHDLFEDTDANLFDVEGKVHIKVLYMMNILNKFSYSSYERYIYAVGKQGLARVVKIADLIDNLGHKPRKNNIKKYLQALKMLL